MRQTDVSHVLLAVLLSLGVMINAIADSYSTGSGCFISSNEVLTAYHVVADSSEITVALEDGDWMKATIMRSDKGLDWALLKVQGNSLSTVSVSERSLDLGNKVYTLGYPSASILGLGLKYADGVVSSLTGLAGDVNRFQMTVPIQPGNSGGPVFDEKGSLVGIVSSTIDPDKFYAVTGGALPQNVNFAVPVGKIPLRIRPDNGNELKNNKDATCFVRSKVGGAKQTVSKFSESRKPVDVTMGKIKSKDAGDIKGNVGVVDVGKLFSFELGKPYPSMLHHKVYEKDNTVVCHYAYDRPFLNFRNGRSEISKKSSTLIKLYAYTGEYDVLDAGRAYEDAERAVSLIEEKFGIKLEKSFLPTRVGGFSDQRPLRVHNAVVSSCAEWTYTSWPNYYNQGADFKNDPHHTITVILYQHFKGGYSTRSIWIGLVGTSEDQFAAEEVGAKERDAKRHQEVLDSL